jgi:hypothetical protein
MVDWNAVTPLAKALAGEFRGSKPILFKSTGCAREIRPLQSRRSGNALIGTFRVDQEPMSMIYRRSP